MAITSLGYMGIRSAALNDWSDYARRLLGMQQVDRGGGTLCFRMDDWQQRLVVLDEPGDEFAFMGWQVSDPADLDRVLAEALAHDGPALVDVIAQPLDEAAAPVMRWMG